MKGRTKAKDDKHRDIERDRLIEYGKKIGQNERQCLKLMTDVQD